MPFRKGTTSSFVATACKFAIRTAPPAFHYVPLAGLWKESRAADEIAGCFVLRMAKPPSTPSTNEFARASETPQLESELVGLCQWISLSPSALAIVGTSGLVEWASPSWESRWPKDAAAKVMVTSALELGETGQSQRFAEICIDGKAPQVEAVKVSRLQIRDRVVEIVEVDTSTSEAGRAQENLERLELVISGTRLGMWDWYPQTNEVVFNELWAQMLGYQLEEIPASLESWQSRVHPEDLQACFDDLGKHIRGEVEFYQNVHRMLHKDGHWVYILDRGKIMKRDAQGNPVRFTGTHTDISEQKYAELAAQRADRAKSEFLANMSHEIRTPLNAVIGFSALLGEMSLEAEAERYVRHIGRAGRMLLERVNDILDYSKIESGHLQVFAEPTQPIELVQDVVDVLSGQAQAKGLSLILELQSQPQGLVEIDRKRVSQVLLNLTANAIKFTQQGEVRMKVRYDAASSALQVDVCDTGHGIAADRLEAIFEPFEQESAATSRNSGGTGLGLAISKRLMEAMHGTLAVESEIGRGSRFSLSCPAPAVAVAVADDSARQVPFPRRRASDNKGADFTGLQILVADDNRANQLVASAVLASMGIRHVDVAYDGKQALEMVKGGSYDLVFLDLAMPVMDGFEACSEIRAWESMQLPGTKPLPIVALSAHALSSYEQRAHSIGMNGYIRKPFTRTDVEDELWVQGLARRREVEIAVTSDARGATATASRRLFIVDDDELVHMLVKRALKRHGWQISGAYSAEEALDQIESFRPQAVLSDFCLPGMDGLELVTQLRSLPALAQARVIMSTGLDLEPASLRTLAALRVEIIDKDKLADGELEALLQGAELGFSVAS